MLDSASVGSWRSRLATMVDFKEYVRSSKVYSVVLTILTFVSFLPLCFKQSYPILELIQWPIMVIFILDYFARWVTADIRSDEYSGIFAFVHYPLEFWAIVDLLSILSFVTFLPTTMRLVRLLRLLRLLLVVSLLRYSRGFYVLFESINREKRAMGAVMGFLLGYILLVALIMFNVETTEFETFFDAMYWSATSLATIGYGDFVPVTLLGRTINFISSIIGIGVIALPTGIITSSYVNTLNELRFRYDSDEPDQNSIIDQLAEQRAVEKGVDISEITTDDLFGSSARAITRAYQERRYDPEEDQRDEEFGDS
ncbi:MAG: ion transporter [Actinomycetota bacterium]|nr:ion transporter [Actinomycetota bacterium]